MSTSSKSVFLATLAVCGGSLCLPVSPAPAAMVRTLSEETSTANVTEKPAGDVNLNAGQSTLVGPVGNCSITITTSNRPGASNGAILQLISLDVHDLGSSAQAPAIALGDTNFFQSSTGPSNTQNGPSGPAVTATDQPSGNLAAVISPKSASTLDVSVPLAPAAPYLLTNLTVMTLSPEAQSNVPRTTAVPLFGMGAVPEPATLALLLPGALALAARRRVRVA